MRSEFTGSAAFSGSAQAEQVSSLNHFAGTDGSTSQRASWNDNQKALLLQVLNSFPRAHKGGWRKDVWEKITDYMNRKFPKSIFTTQQLKQQEKDLHKLYKQVKEILNRPGFQWDTSNCMLEASNNCWRELSQSRGKLSWSRSRRIPYYHRLVALYEGCDAEVEASQLVPLQSNSSGTEIQANRDEDGIVSLSNSEEDFFFFHGLVPSVAGPELVVVPSVDSGVINHRFQLMSPDHDLDIILSPSNPISNSLAEKPDPQPAANYIKAQPSDLVENSRKQINDKSSCLSTVFPENPVYGDLSDLSNQISRNNPVTPSNIQAFSEFPDHPSFLQVSSVENPQGNISTINDNGMVNFPGLSTPQLISAISSDKSAVLNSSKGLMVNPNSNRTIPAAQKMSGNFSFLRQLSSNNTRSGVSSLNKCAKICPLNNHTDMGHTLNLSAPLNQDNASNSEQHGKQDRSSSDPEENPVRKIRGKQFPKKKIAKNPDYSMIRCINMFYKLPGFEKSDIVDIVGVFRDELYRQAFVAMKKSHKIFWLKSIISKPK